MSTDALVKSSTLVIYEKNHVDGDNKPYGRVVSLSGPPTFNDSFDSIERNITRQAFSTYAPLRGLETTSGQLNVELYGKKDNNALDNIVLWKSAFGALICPSGGKPAWVSSAVEIGTTANITDSITTTSVSGAADPVLYSFDLLVADATKFQVNFPVRIYSGNTLKCIGFITAISSNTLTIITQNKDGAESIADGDTVDCGYLLWLSTVNSSGAREQVTDLLEFNADYYRGGLTKEAWTGNIVTECTLDFSTGQIVVPSFSFEGAEVGYTANKAYSAADYNGITANTDPSDIDPIVVQLTDFFINYKDDNSTDQYFQDCISNLQISITNELFKKQCMASLGIKEVRRTARKVTGSFNTFYTSSEFQENFRKNIRYNLRALFNYSKGLDANGNKKFDGELNTICALAIPQLTLSDVQIEEDSGIYKYNNTFSAEPIDGDDEILIAFL